MLAHPRDARGLQVFRSRVEHGKESPYDHVVELLLGFVQLLGRLQGGDDGEVVRDLGVVEHTLVRPYPALLQYVPRKGGKRPAGAERLERLLHRADVILGQRPRIRSGISKNFVPLVQGLGERQSHPGGKTKPGIGVALQARQIEQQRGELGRRPGLLARDPALAAAIGDDRLGLGGGPKPLCPALSVVILLEPGVEPAPGVFAGPGGKLGVHFPVTSRREGADFLLALHEDGERRGLHAADGSEVKAPFLGIEGGHCASAVDAHQPIGLGAALGGVGEWQQFPIRAQAVEAVADRLRRHRLQPEALDRLSDARVLDDVAEDQLALASRVAGVDEAAHIPSLHQPQQQVEPLLALLERRQLEVRRNHRQVFERPLAFLHLVLVRNRELKQMADRGRQQIFFTLEVIALAHEATERARDVGGDRRLLCDDEFFSHAARKAGDDKCKPASGSTALRQ